MDLLLRMADDIVLDKVWANVLPLSAFALPASFSNSTASSSSIPLLSSSSSKWSQIISRLPRPASVETMAENIYLSQSTESLSAWPRDYFPRQLISVFTLTFIGIHVLYFLFAGLSYQFIFNHDMMRHPRFLKNQVKLEIKSSLKAFPGMILLTMPWFMAEVRGYSKMYDNIEDYGLTYFLLSPIIFLLFTDYCIYWIHRWLHIPIFYKTFHKPHHKWIIPTPFASHAFHPVDGYLQSVPYHLFIFFFPLHQGLYLALFVAVNFWSIFIHDSDMITGSVFEKVINGPAHHTLHHIYFTVNYGQYFTWADRYGNSYRQPHSKDDPLLDVHKQDGVKVE